jgi:hypothetical protein
MDTINFFCAGAIGFFFCDQFMMLFILAGSTAKEAAAGATEDKKRCNDDDVQFFIYLAVSF